jgi:Tfp pilus assembly protein PilO
MRPKIFFFIVLGLMLVVAGLGGAGYYFAYKYMNTKSAEYSVKLAEQKEADQQIEQLNRLERQYERDVEPILPLIDATLPHEKKQSEVLAQVQRIAASTGLLIDGVLVPGGGGLPSGESQTVKAGKVLAMPLNFKVKGPYAKLQEFTAKLENLNRFTNITSLSVKRDAPGVATYTFSLNAYIKP